MKDIKLKYFKCDKSKYIDKKAICVVCNKKGIEIGASTKNSTPDKPELICLDCAIKDYAQNHKIKDFTEAKKKRQRMFDVSYLLFEILIDDFVQTTGKKEFRNLSEKDIEFNYALSQEIYNNISKKEKERLEGLPQDEIEMVFRKKIKIFFTSQELNNEIIFSAKSDLGGKIIKEYIDFHKYLKNDTPTKQEINEAIKTMDNFITTNEAKKIAILVLAHAGTKEALKALKEFSAQAGLEMKIWAEQAIGECQLFMENN